MATKINGMQHKIGGLNQMQQTTHGHRQFQYKKKLKKCCGGRRAQTSIITPPSPLLSSSFAHCATRFGTTFASTKEPIRCAACAWICFNKIAYFSVDHPCLVVRLVVLHAVAFVWWPNSYFSILRFRLPLNGLLFFYSRHDYFCNFIYSRISYWVGIFFCAVLLLLHAIGHIKWK